MVSRARRGLKPLVIKLLPSRLEDIREALSLLTPWNVGVPLIRVGGSNDGGYLIPDDNAGVGALFSPGVADTWSFELDLAANHDIRSYMIDGSIESPPSPHPLMSFEPLWLAGASSPGRISLNDWVFMNVPEPSTDIALQMDIEGAEYEVLASVTDEILRRFRWAVVEYHGLDLLAYRPRARRRILPVLRKMSRVFDVVHVHANNCCGLSMMRGLVVPRVLEVTYLRRDRAQQHRSRVQLPHALDRDCMPEFPRLTLPPNWPD
jgi:hypothetical protein